MLNQLTYRGKTALITGGAGFIGSHLAAELASKGIKVRVLDDLSSGSQGNLAGTPHEFLHGSVLDRDAIERATIGVDIVFHMAGFVSVPDSFTQQERCMMVNHLGTVNTLRAAENSGAKRLVFAGTAAVYGATPELPCIETATPDPSSPYALSKLAGEQVVTEWGQTTSLDTATLRFFNVYGGRQTQSNLGVIGAFAATMSERGYATIYGDGSATRDFICIDDVVAATMSAAFCEHDLSGEVINIGSGHATSITDIHEMVFEAVQSTMGSVGRPKIIPTRVGDVKNSLADINKAATQLSWFPRNNLSAGISKVVAAQFHSALRHSHAGAGSL